MLYKKQFALCGMSSLAIGFVVAATIGAFVPALGQADSGEEASTTQPAARPVLLDETPLPADDDQATDALTIQPVESGQQDVRVTRPGTFEIHYRDADLRGLLQLLSSQSRKNIVATKEVTGTFTADLYDVTFWEALDAILKASGYVYVEKGNFIYVYTIEQWAAIKKAERRMEVRVFTLSYVTAGDAKTLITPVLSKDGVISVTPDSAVGITTSSTESGGNSYATGDVLVVRDYEENLARAAEIIQELDVKPDQVLIEATLLRATLTENNALGIDFNVLAGIDFEAMASVSPGLQDMTTGNVAGPTLNRNAATFRTDFNASVPAGGLSVGIITNDMSFFIRALETVTDVTVMANPKLLIVNKQRGEVMVGNRDGYLTTTVTDTVATQTVEFLETGTRLVVRPFIGKNGYVRLEIHPEDSSGSVVQIGGSVLPSETTTEVTSNVLVRDGRTIVIGGLFRERTSNGRGQVPLVGDIPYLGTLFRQTADNTTREEVIILVTPRIIKQDTDEDYCNDLKEDLERYRIGQRKGMRWWGRERISQRHMRSAKRALTDGRKDQALWYVDMALAIEPRLEEAIRLKEKLTKKAYWSEEAQTSAVSNLIERMIMKELGKPIPDILTPKRPLDKKLIDPKVREARGIRIPSDEPSVVQPTVAPQPQPEPKAPQPAASPAQDEPVSTPQPQPAK